MAFHTQYATPQGAVHAASIHRLTAEQVWTACFYNTLCMAFHTQYATPQRAAHAASIHRLKTERVLTTRFHSTL